MMRLVAFRAGSVVMDVGRVQGGAPGDQVVCPIMSFVIEVDRRVVLFDTGMNPAVRVDAEGYWGRVARRVLVPHLQEGEELPRQLERAGYPTTSITHVVNSHLHNDHAGTNLCYPNARVLIRRSEWLHATSLMDEPSSGYVRGDFFDGDDQPELIDYDDRMDLFGDGAVTLLSTPGHTPGHQSLVVSFPSGRTFVLSGDAVYSRAAFDRREAPVIAWDTELAARSVEILADLEQQGATVLVCHDGPTWAAHSDTQVIHAE